MKPTNCYVPVVFWAIQQNVDSMTTKTLEHCIKFLHTIGQVIGSPLTQYQVVMLQKYFRRLLLHYTTYTLTQDVHCWQNNLLHAEISTQVWVCSWHGVHCHLLLIQRSLICDRDDKGQVSTARSDVYGHEDPYRYTEAVGDSPCLPR